MKNFIKQIRNLLFKMGRLLPSKEWFVKNRFKILIIAIVISAFYWYEWRPSIIKQNCSNNARENAIEKRNRNEYTKEELFYKDDYDFYYKMCLGQKGL